MDLLYTKHRKKPVIGGSLAGVRGQVGVSLGRSRLVRFAPRKNGDGRVGSKSMVNRQKILCVADFAKRVQRYRRNLADEILEK